MELCILAEWMYLDLKVAVGSVRYLAKILKQALEEKKGSLKFL